MLERCVRESARKRGIQGGALKKKNQNNEAC